MVIFAQLTNSNVILVLNFEFIKKRKIEIIELNNFISSEQFKLIVLSNFFNLGSINCYF